MIKLFRKQQEEVNKVIVERKTDRTLIQYLIHNNSAEMISKFSDTYSDVEIYNTYGEYYLSTEIDTGYSYEYSVKHYVDGAYETVFLVNGYCNEELLSIKNSHRDKFLNFMKSLRLSAA